MARDWLDTPVRIFDTAGMRRRAKVQEKLEKLSVADGLRAVRFAEVVVVAIDALIPLEKQDLKIADLAEREGRAVVLAITKWDLIEDKQAKLVELREEFERLLPQIKGAPLIPISSISGRGLDKIMPAVSELHKNWDVKVKTRDLNDWLAEMVQRHPPPAVDGRRVKPRYLSQTKARPPTFVLMASRASQLPDSYKRYLMNGLREAFDLPGVPIRLIVKGQKNPYAKDK